MAELEQGLEELKVVKQTFKDNFDSENVSTTNVEFRNMPQLLKQMEKKLPTQTKSVEPTKFPQVIKADDGYKLEEVGVREIPSQYIIPTGTKEITENNEYDVTEYSKVKVEVANAGTGTGGNPKFSQLIDGSIESLEESDLSEPNTIRDYAFYGCTNLTSAVIPGNINTIGANSFQNCTNLQTLILAEGVITIGTNAFNNTAISVLDIPASVISIGDGAFAGTNITEIDMSKHPIPPSITNTSLPSSLTTIKVAYRNYDTYLSEWSDYADKIVRLPAIPSTIRVVVNNYLGELVSGASVTISGNGQVFTGTTDSVGVFEQGDLQPATYTISVADLDGFKTPDRQEVIVEEASTNVISFTYAELPKFSTIFAENTPQQISAVSDAISKGGLTSAEVEATYGWKIGDTISYQLTTGENVEMRIIGFNHDDKSDGSGRAGITLQMVNCLATSYEMNDTNTNSGGYVQSKMNTETMPAFKLLLPQEWQNVIQPIIKKTTAGGQYSYTQANTHIQELFLLSLIEIYGSSAAVPSTYANEGSVYEYWNYKNTDADRIKKYDKNVDGIPETAAFWWLRSAYYGDRQEFEIINSIGRGGAQYANSKWYVSFAFCV